MVGANDNCSVIMLAQSVQNGKLRRLRDLDLSFNNMGCDGAAAFGKAIGLGEIRCLRDLRLEDNNISERGGRALAQGIYHGLCPELRNVSLKNNSIGKAAVKLVHAFKSSDTLEQRGSLYLDPLSTVMAQELKVFVKWHKYLAATKAECGMCDVDMFENREQIGDEGCEILEERFQDFGDRGDPGDEYNIGVGIIKKRVADLPVIRKLDINNSGITPAGAASLSAAVMLWPSLVELNLKGNRIGDAGVKSLGDPIAKGLASQLTSLNLQDNQLTSYALMYLAIAIDKGGCGNLQSLQLSGNPFPAGELYPELSQAKGKLTRAILGQEPAERLNHPKGWRRLPPASERQWKTDLPRLIEEHCGKCPKIQVLEINETSKYSMRAIAEAVMGQDGVKTFVTRIKHGAYANICCLNLGNPHDGPTFLSKMHSNHCFLPLVPVDNKIGPNALSLIARTLRDSDRRIAPKLEVAF